MAKLVNMGKWMAQASKPHVQTFWYYGRVELAPPKLSEIPTALKEFSNIIGKAKSGAWKNLTVKEVFLNFLVGLEVAGWFFVGECIGKRSIVGYDLS